MLLKMYFDLMKAKRESLIPPNFLLSRHLDQVCCHDILEIKQIDRQKVGVEIHGQS